MRCLDGQCFSSQTLEMRSFDLDALRRCSSPGEREFQGRTSWCEDESILTPETRDGSSGFTAHVLNGLQGCKLEQMSPWVHVKHSAGMRFKASSSESSEAKQAGPPGIKTQEKAAGLMER